MADVVGEITKAGRWSWTVRLIVGHPGTDLDPPMELDCGLVAGSRDRALRYAARQARAHKRDCERRQISYRTEPIA